MSRFCRLLTLALLAFALLIPAALAEPGQDAADSSGKHNPRFLLLISEQNLSAQSNAWWTTAGGQKGGVSINLGLVENTFVESLHSGGYMVLDHQVLAGQIVVPQPLRILAPGNEEAGQIGQLFGADYVILGKAVATQTGDVEGSGIHSATATVSVRVVNAKTAEIVATANDKASAMNANLSAAGSAALQKAGQKSAENLIKAMNSKPGIKAFILD
jgi:hypothetical protein